MFNSMKARVAAAAVALVAMVGQASAALPTAATDALTALDTDGTAMIAAIWPVVVSITIGFVLIKLFKRASGKV